MGGWETFLQVTLGRPKTRIVLFYMNDLTSTWMRALTHQLVDILQPIPLGKRVLLAILKCLIRRMVINNIFDFVDAKAPWKTAEKKLDTK